VQCLKRIPVQSADAGWGWFRAAWHLYSHDEKEQALDAARQAAVIATESRLRYATAYLLASLGHPDKARDVMLRDREKEVPQRRTWLPHPTWLPLTRETLSLQADLADCLVQFDSRFVRAQVTKADVLRRMGRYKETLFGGFRPKHSKTTVEEIKQ
jgi:hypothetical protein